MDINNLFNKFLGAAAPAVAGKTSAASGSLGGMAGGALAGGLMALLMGDKGVRKLAGKAATVGGMALVGGLAYQAYKNWQDKGNSNSNANGRVEAEALPQAYSQNQEKLALTLIKAMVYAAKSDGHIDSSEQQKIFSQVNSANLSSEEKSLIFDLLSRQVDVAELANEVSSLEQKSEIYLVSCLTCQGEHPDERKYLANLAESLALPGELVAHLEKQAIETLAV